MDLVEISILRCLNGMIRCSHAFIQSNALPRPPYPGRSCQTHRDIRPAGTCKLYVSCQFLSRVCYSISYIVPRGLHLLSGRLHELDNAKPTPPFYKEATFESSASALQQRIPTLWPTKILHKLIFGAYRAVPYHHDTKPHPSCNLYIRYKHSQ